MPKTLQVPKTKAILHCTDFDHPNDSQNACPGELVDVGGENGSVITTRLRCNNRRCQRTITIDRSKLEWILQQKKERSFHPSQKDK